MQHSLFWLNGCFPFMTEATQAFRFVKGSSDASASCIRRARPASRLRFLLKVCQGNSGTRSLGIGAASGLVILWNGRFREAVLLRQGKSFTIALILEEKVVDDFHCYLDL
jgi:hypothetical protein